MLRSNNLLIHHHIFTVCMNYPVCGRKVFLSSRPWTTLSFPVS
nr:MAG TPA: hypothetical protein [Caudoviricetes sp.]